MEVNMGDEYTPHMRGAYEEHKRENPEEVAEAQRKAREIVFKCTGVLRSYENSMPHVSECKKCAQALGVLTIDIELPKAPR